MSFLLDSETVIRVLKNHPAATHRFQMHLGQLHLSVVTMTEVEQWLLIPRTPPKYLPRYLALVKDFIVQNADRTIAERGGRLGARCRALGFRLSTADLLLTATAIVHKLTLVSPAVRHFGRIPGLTVVDWLTP